MWYKNIAGRFFGLVTKHTCYRQTDRQNYDSQDRTNIAASRGNKTEREIVFWQNLPNLELLHEEKTTTAVAMIGHGRTSRQDAPALLQFETWTVLVVGMKNARTSSRLVKSTRTTNTYTF